MIDLSSPDFLFIFPAGCMKFGSGPILFALFWIPILMTMRSVGRAGWTARRAEMIRYCGLRHRPSSLFLFGPTCHRGRRRYLPLVCLRAPCRFDHFHFYLHVYEPGYPLCHHLGRFIHGKIVSLLSTTKDEGSDDGFGDSWWMPVMWSAEEFLSGKSPLSERQGHLHLKLLELVKAEENRHIFYWVVTALLASFSD